MQIRRCIASKPGLFANRTLDFSGRTTIVYGRNASGKTFLARAIMDLLWETFSGRGTDGSLWNQLYLEVHFTHSSREYRFIRNGERYLTVKSVVNGEERDLLKENLQGEAPAAARAVPSEDRALGDLLSLVDPASYYIYSFLPSPLEVSRDAAGQYACLKKFFSEDSSRFSTMFRNIENAFGEGDTTGRVPNVLLDETLKTEGRLKEQDKKIQIIDIQSSKTEKLDRERSLIDEEIRKIEAEIAAARNSKNILLNIQRNLKISEEARMRIGEILGEIQREEAKIRTVADLEKQVLTKFPQFRNFSETNRQNLKKIQETYKDIRNINEAIESFFSLRRKRKRRTAFTSLLSGLAAVIGVFLVWNRNIPPLPNEYRLPAVIGLLALSSLLSLAALLVYLFTLQNRERNRLMTARGEIEEKLRKILNENNIQISEYKMEEIYEFLLQYFQEYGGYTEKQLELFQMKDSLKDRAAMEDLRGQLDRLQREEKAAAAEMDADLKGLSEAEGAALSTVPPDQGHVNGRIAGMNNRIKSLRESIEAKNTILLKISEDIHMDVNRTDERQTLLEARRETGDALEKLNAHARCMRYLRDVYREAVSRREEKQLRRLIRSMLDIFHHLTDNQFITMIDETSLRKIVVDGAMGGDFNPAMVHIMLLSLKLALTDFMVDSGTVLPFIIDDPFLFMDDIRISRLKNLVDSISEKRQIIIFTHNNTFRDWGSFIEL